MGWYSNEEQEAMFARDLEESHKDVWLIGDWFNRAWKHEIEGKVTYEEGFEVTFPGRWQVDRHQHWRDHPDTGDLFVTFPDVGKRRVEVKGNRSWDFTYSWFKETFIVCKKFQRDDMEKKNFLGQGPPIAYIHVNQSRTHIAVIFEETREHWEVADIQRRNDNRIQTHYVIPSELLKFWGLADGSWTAAVRSWANQSK